MVDKKVYNIKIMLPVQSCHTWDVTTMYKMEDSVAIYSVLQLRWY